VKKHIGDTIFLPDGRVNPAETEKQLICNTHLKLAHLIERHVADIHVRMKMLSLLDSAYGMGKRMDRGLMHYRDRLGLTKLEGKAVEKEWEEFDVVSS
jgi:hypothetical protein